MKFDYVKNFRDANKTGMLKCHINLNHEDYNIRSRDDLLDRSDEVLHLIISAYDDFSWAECFCPFIGTDYSK